eukprot:CAMPEP_0119133346 /NCGR_PEP_ID=MMETSP1310-20130426/13327_1 /TAXON_ID=464262 /ORGANISM="Genus nov. species nov., Strain RCC2339" /LENGTH=69 /DNA_ID=CAMNT_0007124033 /DNA_START=224 /DNA_END=429 /DNA_ORIENTATION=+
MERTIGEIQRLEKELVKDRKMANNMVVLVQWLEESAVKQEAPETEEDNDELEKVWMLVRAVARCAGSLG